MKIDRELVIRAKRGETQAQEELVGQLAPMVFGLASRFFRSREDVEDLSQEAFVRFFGKIDRVRPDDNVAAWVSRLTINVCYDRLRKLQREKLALEEYRVLPSAPNADDPEDYEWVWSAVNTLDAKLRIPLLLKEVDELSIKEIFDVTGLSVSNVKIRLYRARKKLALMLGAQFVGPLSAAQERSA